MPKKILLADDSITIQKVVELTFSDGDYEVIATSNGAKAIQKLSEVRPDIILSDIIMPEKNGYEVCEYVKSHPEFRTIPVILLTGTFEPFDPDRAEKAGCDAVVTKPFESQSLIHKVEELLAQSASSSSAAGSSDRVQPPAQSQSPQKMAAAPAFESQWDTSAPEESIVPEVSAQGFETEDDTSDKRDDDANSGMNSGMNSDSEMEDSPFGAAPEDSEAPSRAASPSDSGFQLDDPFTSSSSPASETAPPDNKGEDLFGDSSRDASSAASLPFESPATTSAQDSPFDSTTPFGGGETRAFPRMSFDDLAKMKAESENEQPQASASPQAPPPAASESPWVDPSVTESAFGGETRAFPRMSFEDLQKVGLQEPSQSEPIASAPEPKPEAPAPEAFSGETRAFPRMSLEELQKMSTSDATGGSWPSEAKPVSTDWPTSAATPAFDSEPLTPSADVLPFAQPEGARDDESMADEKEEESSSLPQQSVWATPAQETPVESSGALSQSVSSSQVRDDGVDPPFPLTDEQIEKIARRVVELMSQETVRNIAWEVIPDMAQMAVRERIRELEAES